MSDDDQPPPRGRLPHNRDHHRHDDSAHHHSYTTAADASFLEQMSGSGDAAAASIATVTTNASQVHLQELHQSNLLRLQTEELLQESMLYLTVPNNDVNSSSTASKVVKWAPFAHEYLQHVSSIIQEEVSLENVSSSSSSSSLPMEKNQKKKNTTDVVVNTPSRLTVASNSSSNIINNYLGLTTTAGNAQVLPTLQIHVQIPNDVFDQKDYLRHRYFQKRNVIAWHVAQHLAQAKYTGSVGKVYWQWRNVDQRQVVLVLIPPTKTATTDDPKEGKNNKKKTKKGAAKQQQQDIGPFTANAMPKRVRFRVHIHFVMSSPADWIPPLRLVPNRCNLPSSSTTSLAAAQKQHVAVGGDATTAVLPLSQMYNHALTEDAIGFHVTNAALSLSSHSHNDHDGDDDDDDDSMEDNHDSDKTKQESYPHLNTATVLAKIWMLQRGLLNRHDGYHDSEHLISIQLLYLYRTRRVSPRLGPLQVLQAWFKLLAETNWLGDGNDDSNGESEDTNGLIRKAPSEAYRETGRGGKQQKRSVLVLPHHVGQGLPQTIAASSLARLYAQQTKESPLTKDKSDPPTLLELYQSTTWYRLGPVLLDSTMRYNFMGRISPAFMRLLQREARKSLAVLQHDYYQNSSSTTNDRSSSINSHHHVIQPFSYLFMKPARFWNRHDAYLYIPLKEFDFDKSTLWGNKSNKRTTSKQGSDSKVNIDPLERHDYGDYEAISRGLVTVLRMALGDRVRDIQLLTTGNGIVGGGKDETVTRNDDSTTAIAAVMTDPILVDSNETPTFPVSSAGGTRSSGVTPTLLMKNKRAVQSPTGSDVIVLGVTLNADTCHRIVDRGPPADDLDATKRFLELWGEKKAELRRFKDGAIVHAVVWGSTPTAEEQREEDNDDNADRSPYIRFQNDDKVQGGIVERATRHILRLHFLKNTTPTAKQPSIQFSMRSMMSAVDSVVPRGERVMTFNPLAAHRMVLKAFDSLSDFLKKQSLPSVSIPGTTKLRSPLGIPLAIDAVEPLAPALRYCELFPPIPHPSLGGAPIGAATGQNKKLTGAILSDPILIQIRFGASSKWPNDLKAIGAAKTAMLVQLVSGIEQLRKSKRGFSDNDLIHAFDGPTAVSPGYADIGFMGYVFRILVRADPELKLLNSLTKPGPEAASLLRTLSRRHVVAAMHHSMVHAVYTSHPSSSAVVRLARRWVASHLLSGMIPLEAVELLVVHIYSDRASPLDPPGTVMAGFLRFLQLLAGHNWSREPLIVDPQGHLTEDDCNAITADFEILREKASATPVVGTKTNTSTSRHGPPMFIVSPCDRHHGGQDKPKDVNRNSLWMPTFTMETPEWVVLNRAAKLAQRSFTLLRRCLMSHAFGSSSSSPSSSAARHPSWTGAFQETMESFRAYSAIFRVHPDFLVDNESSSSTSGTTDMRRVVRRNTDGAWESSYTKSMGERLKGPKDLRMKKLYKNLVDTLHHDDDDDDDDHANNKQRNSSPLLLEWRPVESMIENLRRRLGHTALFFYNDLCPEVIGVLWRPQLFVSKSFSAITSECVRPVVVAMPTTQGKVSDETSLVVVHASDLLRVAAAYTADMVMDIKVFYPPLSSCDTETPEARKSSLTGKKRLLPAQGDDDDDDDEGDEQRNN